MKKKEKNVSDLNQMPDFEEDIYDEEYRRALLEGDEISINEEAFLKGYEEAY